MTMEKVPLPIVIAPEEKELIVSSLIFHRPKFELYSEELEYIARVKVLLEKLRAI